MALASEQLQAAHRYIPNLRIVSDHLVRGGQPEPQGLHELKNAGVRTIISLCGGSIGLVNLLRGSGRACREDPETVQEKATADKLGLQYISIPLDVFAEPPMEAIDQFLAVVNDPAHHAVFVHCLHGRDRTGLLTAVYRVMHDGWEAERAYAEMLDCGFDMSRTNLSDALFAIAKQKR